LGPVATSQWPLEAVATAVHGLNQSKRGRLHDGSTSTVARNVDASTVVQSNASPRREGDPRDLNGVACATRERQKQHKMAVVERRAPVSFISRARPHSEIGRHRALFSSSGLLWRCPHSDCLPWLRRLLCTLTRAPSWPYPTSAVPPSSDGARSRHRHWGNRPAVAFAATARRSDIMGAAERLPHSCA